MNDNKLQHEKVSPWLMKAKVSPPRQISSAFFPKILKSQLNAALVKPVILIEAPAGFGKSTLLAQWREDISHKEMYAAWISTDESDDPDSFVGYMAFAFHIAGLDMSEHGLLSPHFKGERRIIYALNAFIAAIERSEKPAILFLDDFERASPKIVTEVVARLLENLPENLTLVIACRHNPGLSLSRLEISGLLYRINADNLRLGVDEVFQVFGESLTEAEAHLIIERTAGWPVAIQLLKTVCGGSPAVRQDRINKFTGASDQAATYFSEQLIASLTEDQQEFLSDISVLERVSPEACNYLRERTDSITLMASLKNLDSLFPESEQGGQVRRLHPLFREHLETTQKNMRPEHYDELHRRAACWAFEQGEIQRAIAHAKKAGDEDMAGHFVEKTKGLQIWINEGMDRLEDLINLLSPRVLETYPRLILALAIIEMKKGHIKKARKFLNQASIVSKGFTEDRPGGDGKLLLTDRYLTESLLLGYCCLPFHRHMSKEALKYIIDNSNDDPTIRGFFITIDCLSMQQVGQFDLAVKKGKEAIVEYRLAHSNYGELFIYIHTGMVALAQGRMADVKKLYEKATRLSREHFPGDGGLKSTLDACWAEYYWEIGDIRAASRYLGKVPLTLENKEAWFDIYMAAFRTNASLRVREKDKEGLDTFFTAALLHTRTQELERLENYVEALQISAFLDFGLTTEAIDLYDQWVKTGRLKASVWREQEVLYIAQARSLSAKGQDDAALNMLKELVDIAKSQGNHRNMAYGLCWQLLLANVDSQSPAITQALVDLACLVEDTPEPQPLMLLQSRIEILKECALTCPAGTLEQVNNLLSLVDGYIVKDEEEEPLFSPRELEVLEELTKGLSDKEIARALDVTPHTVRFHLKNIYVKTDSRNRIEALNNASAFI